MHLHFEIQSFALSLELDDERLLLGLLIEERFRAFLHGKAVDVDDAVPRAECRSTLLAIRV